MVNITNCKEPCFAQMAMGCKILTCECTGKEHCPFYKPIWCNDWIRVERGKEVWLVPPEEYYPESYYNRIYYPEDYEV